MPITPVEIQATSQNLVAFSGDNNPRQMSGAFIVGTKVYAVLWNQLTHEIQAFKSTDGGNTWSALSGVFTGNLNVVSAYDGAHTIAVGTRSDSINTELQLFDLDTDTDTWSGVTTRTTANSMQGYGVAAIHWRLTDFLLLWSEKDPATVNNFLSRAASWDGATVGSDIDVDTSFGTADAVVGDIQLQLSCVDPDGRVHTFNRFQTDDSFLRYYYQAVEEDDTLGTFHAFADYASLTDGVGQPIADGTNVYWPVVVSGVCTLRYGTPIAAPSWADSTIPGVPTISLFTGAGIAALVNGDLQVLIVTDSSASDTQAGLVQAITSDLSSWAVSYIMDGLPANINQFFAAVASQAPSSQRFILLDGQGTDTFFIESFALPFTLTSSRGNTFE